MITYVRLSVRFLYMKNNEQSIYTVSYSDRIFVFYVIMEIQNSSGYLAIFSAAIKDVYLIIFEKTQIDDEHLNIYY